VRTLRLAMAQINTTVGDLEGNTAKVLEWIERARGVEADLVAFPELALTGYPPEDLLFKAHFFRDSRACLDRVIAASRGMTVVVGFVDAQGEAYNAAAVAHNGSLVGVYHKIFLPNYGVFDEERYFKAGTTCPVYVIDGVAIGVNVCEDIWYAGGPTAVQQRAGAEVIVNINSSPFHAGKRDFRERMLATRASDNQLFLAYVNMVGGQDELVFDGASLIFDPEGECVAAGHQFEEDLVVADLNVEGVFRHRLKDPRVRKAPIAVGEIGQPKVIHVPDASPRGTTPSPLPQAKPQRYEGAAEVYEALVLGVRDYVQKSGFKRVLIGMSGGIDSSLTAAIAVDALGKENVQGVSMPSRYTSEPSEVDAAVTCKNLGMDLWTIPIEGPFTAILDVLSETFAGTESGVAEENLQARIRGNILMGISNKFGWMVLTTGNKSEMATGYATLYGDMAGGFAALKDVPKTLVYEASEYRNSKGPVAVIPDNVMIKAPTAELRENQKDEDSLPPYSVLDPIIRAYVEEDWSFEDMVDVGHDAEIVKRVISMVDRNEYKRRQAPPGVKITPRAFGRDRRLPIVNKYRHF
jgi:NAD+ synthase (glutamine-hydrolysing)